MDPFAFPCAGFWWAFLMAFFSAGINALAGGGTLIAFPALLFLGLPPITANATTAVGLLAGSLGGIVGYRRELRGIKKRYIWLVFPAAIGGVIGASLLRVTPHQVFEPLVPFLLLFATLLFALQKRLQDFLAHLPAHFALKKRWKILAIVGLLFVAIYGGYFGAGLSILVLSILPLMGFKDLFLMNGFTSLLWLCVNASAGIIFLSSGMVHLSALLPLAVGAVLGAYTSTLMAHRIGRDAVRKIVIVIGFALSIVTLVEILGHR